MPCHSFVANHVGGSRANNRLLIYFGAIASEIRHLMPRHGSAATSVVSPWAPDREADCFTLGQTSQKDARGSTTIWERATSGYGSSCGAHLWYGKSKVAEARAKRQATHFLRSPLERAGVLPNQCGFSRMCSACDHRHLSQSIVWLLTHSVHLRSASIELKCPPSQVGRKGLGGGGQRRKCGWSTDAPQHMISTSPSL